MKKILKFNKGKTLKINEQKAITGGLSNCSDDEAKCESCVANGGLWISGIGKVCGYCLCPDHSNQL